MQNGPTNAAMVWARFGWRRIALIAASLVLAVALIASLGSQTGTAAVDADGGDGTELVAAKWRASNDSETSSDLYPVEYMMFSRGPSWT